MASDKKKAKILKAVEQIINQSGQFGMDDYAGLCREFHISEFELDEILNPPFVPQRSDADWGEAFVNRILDDVEKRFGNFNEFAIRREYYESELLSIIEKMQEKYANAKKYA